MNKGSRTTYKKLMEHGSIRMGGLVGTKDGTYGCLTYGSCYDKDITLMNSIGASSVLRTPPLKATEVSAHVVSAASVAQNVPLPDPQIELKSSGLSVKKPFIVSDIPSMKEVPVYVAAKATGAHYGRKSMMSLSMMRRGGLPVWGETKPGEGPGFIVYGFNASGSGVVF